MSDEVKVLHGFFTDVAVGGVELIQTANNIGEALSRANNCFPTMPHRIVQRLFYEQIIPIYSEDGDSIKDFKHNPKGQPRLDELIKRVVRSVMDGDTYTSGKTCDEIRMLCGY